jgi:hypothetical protein
MSPAEFKPGAPMNGCSKCNSSILRINARSAGLTGWGR